MKKESIKNVLFVRKYLEEINPEARKEGARAAQTERHTCRWQNIEIAKVKNKGALKNGANTSNGKVRIAKFQLSRNTRRWHNRAE